MSTAEETEFSGQERLSVSLSAKDVRELRAEAKKQGVTISSLVSAAWREQKRQQALRRVIAEYGDIDYSKELAQINEELDGR
ncbi:MAG: hypothetical protein DRJ42_02540 [Deltaproteobacteria bacterium]|nr:MAG: hypothetical protein DRJ42_02540 [Deltaproteobacteria bacterium]